MLEEHSPTSLTGKNIGSLTPVFQNMKVKTAHFQKLFQIRTHWRKAVSLTVKNVRFVGP